MLQCKHLLSNCEGKCDKVMEESGIWLMQAKKEVEASKHQTNVVPTADIKLCPLDSLGLQKIVWIIKNMNINEKQILIKLRKQHLIVKQTLTNHIEKNMVYVFPLVFIV